MQNVVAIKLRRPVRASSLLRRPRTKCCLRAFADGNRNRDAHPLFAPQTWRVYRFILRIVRGHHRWPKDLVSQVFPWMSGRTARASFEGRSQVPRPGCCRIARFQGADLAAFKRPFFEDHRSGTTVREIADESDTPETSAGTRHHEARFLRACRRETLARAIREIINLVYYHEKSVGRGSARFIGIPQSTVKNADVLCRKQLAELLMKCGRHRTALPPGGPFGQKKA